MHLDEKKFFDDNKTSNDLVIKDMTDKEIDELFEKTFGKITILNETKEEGIIATKKLFGLSPEQSFQDLDVDEETD